MSHGKERIQHVSELYLTCRIIFTSQKSFNKASKLPANFLYSNVNSINVGYYSVLYTPHGLFASFTAKHCIHLYIKIERCAGFFIRRESMNRIIIAAITRACDESLKLQELRFRTSLAPNGRDCKYIYRSRERDSKDYGGFI